MSERMGIDEVVALAGQGAADMAGRWRAVYHTAGIPPQWVADETL